MEYGLGLVKGDSATHPDGTRVTQKEPPKPGAEYASSSREVPWDG